MLFLNPSEPQAQRVEQDNNVEQWHPAKNDERVSRAEFERVKPGQKQQRGAKSHQQEIKRRGVLGTPEE